MMRDSLSRSPMDFRQLRYFVSIVDCGSLTKASRLLYIAQPALTQQIAKLEAEVGKSLLHRTAQGVTPTENGQALYHHARLILRQHERALSVARMDEGGLRGTVTLGIPATAVHAMGLPLVRQLRQKYPGLLLNLVEGTSGQLEQLMRVGGLDLAVLYALDALPGLKPAGLLEEEIFALVPRGGGLVPASCKSLTLQEVASLPLILPTGGHGLRRLVSAEFDRRGLAPNVVAEIDSASLVLECVADGLGATLRPTSAQGRERDQQPAVRAIRVADARIVRRNFLYSSAQSSVSMAAAVVSQELREVAAALVEAGQWPGVTLLS